jgi:chromosome transmission fidelity protein 1
VEHSRRERKKALLENRRKLEERLARIRAEEERQRKNLEDPRRLNKKPVSHACAGRWRESRG